MAKKGGAPENLDPVRTKEEAKKRGRNGGKKSGEARRKKRDAKDAAKLILNLPCGETLAKNLLQLGIKEEDYTNRVALFARAFTVALKGDINAMRFLVDIAGETPHFQLEKERFDYEKGIKETGNNAVDDWVDAVIEADKQRLADKKAEEGKDEEQQES